MVDSQLQRGRILVRSPHRFDDLSQLLHVLAMDVGDDLSYFGPTGKMEPMVFVKTVSKSVNIFDLGASDELRRVNRSLSSAIAQNI